MRANEAQDLSQFALSVAVVMLQRDGRCPDLGFLAVAQDMNVRRLEPIRRVETESEAIDDNRRHVLALPPLEPDPPFGPFPVGPSQPAPRGPDPTMQPGPFQPDPGAHRGEF